MAVERYRSRLDMLDIYSSRAGTPAEIIISLNSLLATETADTTDFYEGSMSLYMISTLGIFAYGIDKSWMIQLVLIFHYLI